MRVYSELDSTATELGRGASSATSGREREDDAKIDFPTRISYARARFAGIVAPISTFGLTRGACPYS